MMLVGWVWCRTSVYVPHGGSDVGKGFLLASACHMCGRMGRRHLLVKPVLCVSLCPRQPATQDGMLTVRDSGDLMRSNKGLCARRNFNVTTRTACDYLLTIPRWQRYPEKTVPPPFQNQFLTEWWQLFSLLSLLTCSHIRKLLKLLSSVSHFVLRSKADFYDPTVVVWIGNAPPPHIHTHTHVFEHSLSNWCHCFGRL